MLDDILKKRRSWRQYLKKDVPREILVSLIEAGRTAPVSCNLQATQLIILDNKNILENLSEKVSYKFSFAPSYILVLQDNRYSVKRSSGIVTAGMVSENILLKATDMGLGTCAMAGFEKDDVIRKILDIPEYMEIILLISVGFPDEKAPMFPPEKLDTEEMYSFNNYGNLKTFNPDPTKDSIKDIIDYRRRISGVYLSRFRLNTFKEDFYTDALSFFKDSISDFKNKKYLDVISYDGIFIKKVCENIIDENLSIYASDYLEHNLKFLRQGLSLSGIFTITDKNIFNGIEDKSIDIMSFVFQTQFTPRINELFKEISLKIKKDGFLFVAHIEESLIKRLFKFLHRFILKYIFLQKVNIYENNPYYKVGIKYNLSIDSINSVLKKNNLIQIKTKKNKYDRRNVEATFTLYKKIN